MKSSFVATFNLIWTIYISSNSQVESFEPLLLKMDAGAPNFLQLSYAKIPPQDDENIKALCPARTTHDKEILESISKRFYQTKYCLFEIMFEEPESCTEDVKPLLHLQYHDLTNKPILCGTSPDHQLHQIGFYVCGSVGDLAELHDKNNQKTPEKFIKSHFFPIYDLCIDMSKKRTLWTKHNIMPLELYLNDDKKRLQDESEGDLEINTDALSFTEEYFTEMKKKYLYQNKEMPSPTIAQKLIKTGEKLTKSRPVNAKPFYKMEETFMVPKEHVAIRIWRKAVNHYINVAPFWENRSKLMIAINDRISKLALKMYSQNKKLTVYTSVIDLTDKEHNSMKDSMEFKQNVWFKLLYEERTKSAALIVLQNTPMNPKEKFLCQRGIDCTTMKDWGKDGTELDRDDLAYAYCCYPTKSEIQDIFHVYLYVAKIFDLDQETYP